LHDADAVFEESLEFVDTFHVAGNSGRFDPSTYARLSELWKSFVAADYSKANSERVRRAVCFAIEIFHCRALNTWPARALSRTLI